MYIINKIFVNVYVYMFVLRIDEVLFYILYFILNFRNIEMKFNYSLMK